MEKGVVNFDKSVMKSKKCLKCGGKKFRQEIIEIYDRYLDSDDKIMGFEDEFIHDFKFGKIMCVNCGGSILEYNIKEKLKSGC